MTNIFTKYKISGIELQHFHLVLPFIAGFSGGLDLEVPDRCRACLQRDHAVGVVLLA